MKTIVIALSVCACVLIGTGCKKNSPPVTPAPPDGPSVGAPDETLKFRVVTSDPENDGVLYRFDWGGDTSGWYGVFPVGETCQVKHAWADAGTYQVRAQAQDDEGKLSLWSDAHALSIESVSVHPARGVAQVPVVWQRSHIPVAPNRGDKFSIVEH
jgi:hypothetical protein